MAVNSFRKTTALAALAAGLTLAAVPASAQDMGHRGGGERGGGNPGGMQAGGGHQSGGGERGGGNPGGMQAGGGQRGGWNGGGMQARPIQAAPAPQPAPAPQAPSQAWQRGDNRGAPQQAWQRGDNRGAPQQGWQRGGEAQGNWRAPPDRFSGNAPVPADRGPQGRAPDQSRLEAGRPDGNNGAWRRDGNSGAWRRDGDRWQGNSHGWQGRGWNGQGWAGREGYGNGGNWNGGRGGDWSRNWRQDNRYNWRGWRDSHRDVFSVGRYRAPYRDYYYRRLGIGFTLDSIFFGNDYLIDDPWDYRLPPAYGPYRWVRYYDDVLLVNIYDGEVVDVIYDFFY